MQRPERNLLSGDSLAFKTRGKANCRELWYDHCFDFQHSKDEYLNYLWLANNQLTDILPLEVTANSFTIPDNNAMNRAAKRRSVVRMHLPKKNPYIKIVDTFVSNTYFDVVNLDTCNALDIKTLIDIGGLFSRKQIASRCLFFVTFSKWSMRNICYKRMPEYKRIASTAEEASNEMKNIFKSFHFDSTELDGFPITYETGQVKTGHMFSLGWELNKI
ncbi:MAG: hypothetical protein ACRYGG_00855 [Janthinobacterium lividum]